MERRHVTDRAVPEVGGERDEVVPALDDEGGRGDGVPLVVLDGLVRGDSARGAEHLGEQLQPTEQWRDYGVAAYGLTTVQPGPSHYLPRAA